MRGATRETEIAGTGRIISIHAPREGCDFRQFGELARVLISIHAPREGCDLWRGLFLLLFEISIHAPREGCDLAATLALPTLSLFQSTHPVRGATGLAVGFCGGALISIHAPREGCDGSGEAATGHAGISIHAPREGCDIMRGSKATQKAVFQSTHPVRGATIKTCLALADYLISIHAPREGCDCCELTSMVSYSQFQSTHPVRGATARMDFISQNMDTPPIPRHQLYRTIHPHFPRYANPLNRYASRSLTLELSNDKKNTHRPQKP